MANNNPTRNNQPMPLALVLLGNSKSGKSASGNTILGEDKFPSRVSSRAITTDCKKSEENNFCGRQCIVIDTPDFCHVSLSNKSEHVRVCRKMCEGRECVYLLAMQIGRFTWGERDILERLEKNLGRIRDRTIILFTYGDNLKSDQTIQDYTNAAGEDLQSLINKCGNRYLVINNKDTDKKKEQVEELIKQIDKLPEGKKESTNKNMLVSFVVAGLTGVTGVAGIAGIAVGAAAVGGVAVVVAVAAAVVGGVAVVMGLSK